MKQSRAVPEAPKPRARTHGGRRLGAGRKNRSGQRAHVRRPRFELSHPLHVTIKVRAGIPSIRSKLAFRCFREAILKAKKKGLHVTHFAILSNHVHLIIEPPRGPHSRNVKNLARVFQSLCISFAKRLNRILGRKGSVFRDRYHLHVLRSPGEVLNAIRYVLFNESRHEARGTVGKKVGSGSFLIHGPYSSAGALDHATLLKLRRVPGGANPRTPLRGLGAEFRFSRWPEQWLEAWWSQALRPPRSWLLSTGWKITLGRRVSAVSLDAGASTA
jgi:putative transposase